MTSDVGGARQEPLPGLVWHKLTLTPRSTAPVSVCTVTSPTVPTLTVAMATATVPVGPDSKPIPSSVMVKAMAMISGAGPSTESMSTVFTPAKLEAGSEFSQS